MALLLLFLMKITLLVSDRYCLFFVVVAPSIGWIDVFNQKYLTGLVIFIRVDNQVEEINSKNGPK